MLARHAELWEWHALITLTSEFHVMGEINLLFADFFLDSRYGLRHMEKEGLIVVYIGYYQEKM